MGLTDNEPWVTDAAGYPPYVALTERVRALMTAAAKHTDCVSHASVSPDPLWWQARGQVQGMYAAWRVAAMAIVSEDDPAFIDDDAVMLQLVGGV